MARVVQRGEVMNWKLFTFAASAALLAAACGWTIPMGGGSCQYNDTCPGDYVASPHPPPSSPASRCGSNAGCGSRERCEYGQCTLDPRRCASEDECAPGASCVEGLCSCTSDDSCGVGLSCEPTSGSGSYSAEQRPASRCVVCLDGGGCRQPTCDVDGSCPGNLICNREETVCELPPRRTECTEHAECPLGMSCGADAYCARGARWPTTADGGIDASGADATSDSAVDN